MLERKTSQPLCLGALSQSTTCLGGIEVDVTTFLLHDALEKLAQRGVVGLLGESGITSLRGPFIDRAPSHVQGDERLAGEGGREDGAEGRHGLLAPTSLSQGRYAGSTGLFTMCRQHLTDGLAMPHLLEDPAREKRGDLRVLVGRGEQKIPQVADGVVLHVVHVTQGSEHFRGQGCSLKSSKLIPSRFNRPTRSLYESIVVRIVTLIRIEGLGG